MNTKTEVVVSAVLVAISAFFVALIVIGALIVAVSEPVRNFSPLRQQSQGVISLLIKQKIHDKNTNGGLDA